MIKNNEISKKIIKSHKLKGDYINIRYTIKCGFQLLPIKKKNIVWLEEMIWGGALNPEYFFLDKRNSIPMLEAFLLNTKYKVYYNGKKGCAGKTPGLKTGWHTIENVIFKGEGTKTNPVNNIHFKLELISGIHKYSLFSEYKRKDKCNRKPNRNVSFI